MGKKKPNKLTDKIKNKKGLISGRFSDAEDNYILQHYQTQTDAQIAAALHRNKVSIVNRRKYLKLEKYETKVSQPKKYRASYIATLSEDDKQEAFRKEVKSSALYKQMMKILDKEEVELYEDKYVDFLMDPSIETMTGMEKDALHELIMAQIRVLRYIKEERNTSKYDKPISRSREIHDCQDIIIKSQEMLQVQRKQRLKNQNDQAVNFTSLIRELKDPNIRRVVGEEAVMLKFIAEQYYNEHIGSDNNIMSGKNNPYDLSLCFKDGNVPSGINSEDFTRLQNE